MGYSCSHHCGPIHSCPTQVCNPTAVWCPIWTGPFWPKITSQNPPNNRLLDFKGNRSRTGMGLKTRLLLFTTNLAVAMYAKRWTHLSALQTQPARKGMRKNLAWQCLDLETMAFHLDTSKQDYSSDQDKFSPQHKLMVTNTHVYIIHVFVGKGDLRLNRNAACSLPSDWPHPLVLLFVIPVHLYCAVTLFPTPGNIYKAMSFIPPHKNIWSHRPFTVSSLLTHQLLDPGPYLRGWLYHTFWCPIFWYHRKTWLVGGGRTFAHAHNDAAGQPTRLIGQKD